MMCSNPQTIWPHRSIDYDGIEKAITVPCGKCLSCLSNKRNDWSFRLEQEHKSSSSALFVTLTYDRENLAKADYELSKRDLQLYLKRLRKKDGTNKIRYYAVGEYGSRTLRPHYHLLLFNACDFDARQAWGKGIVHIGCVSAASVAYVTKYIVQPELSLGKKVKPFSLMSRAYGIGLGYLTDSMVSWHRSDDRNYVMRYGVQARLPRYYRDKIWYKTHDRERVSHDSKWRAIKQSRKELRWYVKEYGVSNAKKKMAESRNAVIARIKTKVAFTQKL